MRKYYKYESYEDLWTLTGAELDKEIGICEKELEEAFECLFQRTNPNKSGDDELKLPGMDRTSFEARSSDVWTIANSIHSDDVNMFNTINVIARIVYEENRLRTLLMIKKNQV